MKTHPSFGEKRTHHHVSSAERNKSNGYYTNTPREGAFGNNRAPPAGAHFYDLGMQACEPCVSSTTGANWCVYPSVVTWSGEDKDITNLSDCRDYLNTNLSSVRRKSKSKPPQAASSSAHLQASNESCNEACAYLAYEDIDQEACQAGGYGVRCVAGWGECMAGSDCGYAVIPGSNSCTVQQLDPSVPCCDGVTSYSTQVACEDANAPVGSDSYTYLPQCEVGDSSLGCCWTNDEECGGMFSD